MNRKFYWLIALIVFCNSGFCQDVISIQGKITDEKSTPIGFASVYLLNTNIAALSDSNGNFILKNIHEGAYTIAISAIGFATINDQLHVSKENNNTFHFQLADAARQLDAVIVSAEKKEQDVQNIPSSVTALTSKKIDEYSLWNTKDLTAIVPNLYAGNPGDGRNVTSVPVLSEAAPFFNGASATPSLKRMVHSDPCRQTRRSRNCESALTTETPTPCKPPETL